MATRSVEHAATRLPLSKKCITCKTVMPRSAFQSYAYITNQGKESTRLESRCRECAAIRRAARHAAQRDYEIALCRQWRLENPERMRLAIQTWKKNYPERAAESLRSYRANNVEKVRLSRIISEQRRRLRGFSQNTEWVRVLTEAVLELARVGDKYLDAYTGDLIDHPTIDHIIPLSAGGTHTYDNLCVTSGRNNSSKCATPLLLWLVRKAAA